MNGSVLTKCQQENQQMNLHSMVKLKTQNIPELLLQKTMNSGNVLTMDPCLQKEINMMLHVQMYLVKDLHIKLILLTSVLVNLRIKKLQQMNFLKHQVLN
uniref:Uncharacterized protein n=1 Tax=Chloropicon primus TaxID=1764295 RepID=A0A7S2T6D8_9CHLO|mmetsp:Transcript_8860/g.25279  ORF Transcript_8860/g.25279 Transcript_8860/m.25279 type:complete len:100 (+) Transcript_8860:489-788(+)